MLFSNARAQEEFVSPAAKHITYVPFSMLTGGIIILRATLDDNKDSLNFVLDTGSGGISLDSATASYLGVKKVLTDKTVRGIAGVKNVEFSYNHTLHMQGISVANLDFHINNYDILTSAYGLRIDGIVGYSFLRRYIVAIDYEQMVFEVLTPGSYKYPRGGYLMKPQFTTLPMQGAFVKDAKEIFSKFYLDTGAGLCMLLNEDLVHDSALLKSKRKLYPTEAEGLGGKKSMSLTVVKEVKVGPYKFRNVPVYVFDDEFNITQYPVLGGLLGNDIMRRFNVVINYPEQQIFIKPNKRFSDSFDYSYSGLGMYLIDGAITVTDIMKKSPAEDAGFIPGDIVLGVDNDLSGNIQAYKTHLQSAGNKVKVLINRGGELIVLTMKIRSIL
ncbi:aspartyl protease family protein [Panacibacter sp. DH6]|uniref:Aspartyl protease family protein n=2 Tax=Panacibacter microcysteis TaxID=2793269 RepID=A0A931E5Q8_9BACT|nr:aspartyl protease family protein [Panacibacter microcysteis]MBG9375770.1 aspartyl protease family protein [Panacibacter microcysteis]